MPALLESELPVQARARHHGIVVFRPPHRYWAAAFLGAFVASWFVPALRWILLAWVLWVLFLRYREWLAERVIVTKKRIIRVQGIPETTTAESWLRLDRVSGVRIEQTVAGKLLRYATIHLEAPGDHPGVRKLEKIANPHEFYRQLRRIVMGESAPYDPDDQPADFVTEPLPVLPERDRFGRRRG